MKQKPAALKLARQFGLKRIEWKKIKSGVHRVKASNGKSYCMKKMDYPHQEIKWIDAALVAIRNNGFSHLCWCDPEDEHQQLRVKQNGSLVLTPWIEGRTPSAESPGEMYQCAKALAEFHRAGQGIDIGQTCHTRNWLGEWPQRFREYEQLIEGFVRMAHKQPRSTELTRLLKVHGERIVLEARSARKILQNSQYDMFCHKEATTYQTYCHADSGPKNFVLSNTGPVLIDFETLRYDLRIYDLYRMIRLANKSNRWDFTIARSILDGYRHVEKLERSEYELIHAWILFPHKTYRVLRKYAAQSEQGKRKLERKLKKELEARQAIPPFLRSLAQYANQE